MAIGLRTGLWFAIWIITHGVISTLQSLWRSRKGETACQGVNHQVSFIMLYDWYIVGWVMSSISILLRKAILLLFWDGFGMNKTKKSGINFFDPPNPFFGAPVPPGPPERARGHISASRYARNTILVSIYSIFSMLSRLLMCLNAYKVIFGPF